MAFRIGDSVCIVKYGNSSIPGYPRGVAGDIIDVPEPGIHPLYEVRIAPEESGLPEDDFWTCTEDELELL